MHSGAFKNAVWKTSDPNEMVKNVLHEKNIVLGVCGGIAAYKSVELLRQLVKRGARVRVIMTQNACWFVDNGQKVIFIQNCLYVNLTFNLKLNLMWSCMFLLWWAGFVHEHLEPEPGQVCGGHHGGGVCQEEEEEATDLPTLDHLHRLGQ